MFKHRDYNKKLLSPTLVSLVVVSLFVAHPLFAQTTPPPATPHEQGVNEANGSNKDFDNDVQKGKDELNRDPGAQRQQGEVVDGEDGEAGEGDGQNNQQGVDEYGDVQSAENNQGVNEDNKDINNSGIDEVGDANNLNEQSQEIINEHQSQEDGEKQNEQQGEKTTPDNGSSTNQEGTPSQGQDQPEGSSGNQ